MASFHLDQLCHLLFFPPILSFIRPHSAVLWGLPQPPKSVLIGHVVLSSEPRASNTLDSAPWILTLHPKINSWLFFFFFFSGERLHRWYLGSAQESPWWCLGETYTVLGLNLGWLHERQCKTHCAIAPTILLLFGRQ